MPTILAIDQSTSATKALLFDSRSGALIEKSLIEHQPIYPHPGWVEHDAEEIWQNTLAAAQKLKLGEVQFLSITNQRETFVVFDRSGKPLHNAIVWQCRRGESICGELRDRGHEQLVTRKTGLRIDSYFSASKLTWLVRYDTALAKKLAAGQALIGTIDAYLIYRLTRGTVFASDHTNASRTLLLDIHTLKWDPQLCQIFQVPIQALPELRSSTARFGMAQLSGRDIPICGVMGDSQASLFAHRCFEPGMAKVTLGSGSSVLLNIGPKLQPAGDGAVATVAWSHQGVPTYSFEGIINYSGATIGWLRDQLRLIRDPHETEAAAMSVPDNGGVYLVPAFGGLSAPYWSPKARAAIVGMTSHTNRSHIIRAALESIAYQLCDVLEMMRSRGGIELRTINADGGATRNRFLMQFIADMTGLEVTAAQVAECSPLGAAMAGMLGSGLCGNVGQLAKLPREIVTYKPNMSQDKVMTAYLGWKHAVQQVLSASQ